MERESRWEVVREEKGGAQVKEMVSENRGAALLA